MADAARPLAPDALLGALAELLAPKVAELLAARAPETPAYYSQANSPLGKRQYLEAARAGCFLSSKRGKLVLALRADVDAWIAAGARAPREEKPANDHDETKPEADDEAEARAALVAAGVHVAPKGGR